jgi:hypothetical protein
MALTMLDRARWTGKLEEAEVYRLWLLNKLSRPLVDNVKTMEVKRREKSAESGQIELKLAA